MTEKLMSGLSRYILFDGISVEKLILLWNADRFVIGGGAGFWILSRQYRSVDKAIT